MHSDPQISLHAIAVPFNSSRDAKIQRLCRVKVLGGFSPTGLPSTRFCPIKFQVALDRRISLYARTDQFIREKFSDKTPPITEYWKKIGSHPLSFETSRHFKNTLIPIKAMRGRIALQSTSCEITERVISFRGSFRGANAPSRRFYFQTCVTLRTSR
jgi:hypothetical protein